MGMASDVRSVRIATSGVVIFKDPVPPGLVTPTRVRLLAVTIPGSGNVTFRNRDASGEILLSVDGTVGGIHVTIPGAGILFPDGAHVTLSGLSSITVFGG